MPRQLGALLHAFSHKVSPEFKLAIFPKLKPLSYEPGQVIFDKGAPSQDLLFVLHGEVDVLNQKDEHFMKISASEVAMIDSVSGAPLVKLSTIAGGCFGQSVLVGKRRGSARPAGGSGHPGPATARSCVAGRSCAPSRGRRRWA